MTLEHQDFATIMHLSMLSQGEGGRAGGGGILIRHSCPRELLLTLWTHPRVRIFDFALSRGRAVLTVAYIPGRLGMGCFVSRWWRLLIVVPYIHLYF